jgi:NarL family two-component system response regulator LiaR
MIRVVICDDQAVVREGLEMILEADSGIEVVGLAEDGLRAIELATEKKPDLVLMDLNMPGMNGIQATREISKQLPDIKILVLTTFGEDEWVFDAVRSGADGYLLKGTPRQELVAAVKGTVKGESYIDPSIGGKLLSQVAKSSKSPSTSLSAELSDRELEVLKLIAQGFSNAEVAEKLFLTKGTVRNYVSAILSKLDVSDRTQAAVLAIKYGLVE